MQGPKIKNSLKKLLLTSGLTVSKIDILLDRKYPISFSFLLLYFKGESQVSNPLLQVFNQY